MLVPDASLYQCDALFHEAAFEIQGLGLSANLFLFLTKVKLSYAFYCPET